MANFSVIRVYCPLAYRAVGYLGLKTSESGRTPRLASWRIRRAGLRACPAMCCYSVPPGRPADSRVFPPAHWSPGGTGTADASLDKVRPISALPPARHAKRLIRAGSPQRQTAGGANLKRTLSPGGTPSLQVRGRIPCEGGSGHGQINGLSHWSWLDARYLEAMLELVQVG